MKKGRALPPEARKLAAAVKWPLLGFLLCGGQVAGLYAPFALAAVAVAGIRLAGLGAVLGVAGGAFVFMDFQSGLRCAAAAILIFAANTALYDTAVYKKPYFRPACTAVFFLLVQSIYLLGRSASSWLLALCAGAAAAGAAWLRERKLENWGFLCGLALALLPVSAYGFSLGRVALMALLLAAGRGCRVSQCAALGGCLGLLADLTATEPVVLLALIYGAGGAVSGLLRRLPRGGVRPVRRRRQRGTGAALWGGCPSGDPVGVRSGGRHLCTSAKKNPAGALRRWEAGRKHAGACGGALCPACGSSAGPL